MQSPETQRMRAKEVDSDEKSNEDEITTAEEELPSSAVAIHETIRQSGEKELERDSMALLLSAVTAGLSMGTSLLVKGLLQVHTEGMPASFLLENFGYCVGFIIVILAHQQLFTENTITAVLPVMHKPVKGNILLLLRLWGIVLVGNFIGTALIALAFNHMPVFDDTLQQTFIHLSETAVRHDALQMFCGALISGWLIATMVWMFPHAGSAKVFVIIMITWIMSLAGLSHIVVGSVEAFYLVFNGHMSWAEFFWPFALPTLLGNITGGTFIFALLSHVQIRNDMSELNKQHK
ncbi:formate/nitrite transporter family protein [Tatumella sp. JGM118]|uniref:formate/nitrite transporter family protein n=1 Tax=Tatumella sp. JGM118 TaxID=2799796 RepID=UPI001BAE76E0|nr:formate/nitrite transporter family protein [Tatumella sp. JGM118]MBS0909227.1 formate/nitrite transporter family protein [Tatumella sp. JGM118]